MANTANFGIEKAVSGGSRNSWGGLLNLSIDKITELLALALPIGSIQMYGAATVPPTTSGVSSSGGKWLLCDGSLVNRTTYPELFALMGTTYGAGDGSSNFGLPDLRARVPMGYNANTIGSGVTVRSGRAMASSAGGTEGHILTTAQLSAHSHPIPATTHDHDINDVTHEHIGSASGKTAEASAVIVDPQHNHTLQTAVSSWAGGNDYASTGTHQGNAQTTPVSSSSLTGITDSGHAHSFTTTLVGTGLSTTQPEVIGITSTSPDTGGGVTHNNVQPYMTVQYIILAKHPTF